MQHWNALLNCKSKKVNMGDLHLANPPEILGTENAPNNNWGRKVKHLFSEGSLQDL